MSLLLTHKSPSISTPQVKINNHFSAEEIILNISHTIKSNFNNNQHDNSTYQVHAPTTNSKVNSLSVLTLTETMDFSNRSKLHANKIQKNQQQKSQQPTYKQAKQEPPTTTTITPITTSTTIANHIGSSTEILESVPLKTETSSHTSSSSSVEIQKSVEIGASRLQSLEDVETISDESQNIQITQQQAEHATTGSTTRRTKVVPYLNADGFATSPRGNLVREYQEKPYRGKTSLELENVYKDSFNYQSKSTEYKPDEHSREKRKRLQTFILSDVAPQSFKAAASSEIADKEILEEESSIEFETGDSSSTLRNIALPDPQPFHFNLQTGANGFSLKYENPSTSDDTQNEKGPKTQVFTTSTSKAITTPTTKSTTSTTTSTSTTTLPPTTKSQNAIGWSIRASLNNPDTFYAEELLPDTHTPPLRLWRNGRPTPKTNTFYMEPENVFVDSSKLNTATKTLSNSTTTAISTTNSARSFTSTERPIQSFTARATIFKDSLARTTGAPSQRFVSPYKSLENILGEKESNVRTTSKPRYNSPASTPNTFLPSTKTPLRSYFLITSAPKTISDAIATMSTNSKNFSISDTILSTFSTTGLRATAETTITTTEPATQKAITKPMPIALQASTTAPAFRATENNSVTTSTDAERVLLTPSARAKLREATSAEIARQRGRARYVIPLANSNEAATFATKLRENGTHTMNKPYRRKVQRVRVAVVNGNQRYYNDALRTREKYQNYKAEQQQRETQNNKPKLLNRKPIENESIKTEGPRAEALVAFPLDKKQDNSIEESHSETESGSSSSTEQIVTIADRPLKYFYSNKYRQQTAEQNLAEGLQNAGYITSSTGRSKFRPKSVLEQLQLFLAGESDETQSEPQFEDNFTQPEIKAAVEEIKNLYTSSISSTTTAATSTTTVSYPSTTSQTPTQTTSPRNTASTQHSQQPRVNLSTASPYVSSTLSSTTIKSSSLLMPIRASRVNNAIKSSIAAAAASVSSAAAAQTTNATSSSMGRSHKVINHGSPTSASLATSNLNSKAASAAAAAVKCSDSTSNAKCNEIPSRYLLFVLNKTKIQLHI